MLDEPKVLFGEESHSKINLETGAVVERQSIETRAEP